MYFEINVAKKRKGRDGFEHYFATAKRSITNVEQAVEIGKHFKELFPFPEYDVTISFNPETKSGADLGTFLNDPNLLTSWYRK